MAQPDKKRMHQVMHAQSEPAMTPVLTSALFQKPLHVSRSFKHLAPLGDQASSLQESFISDKSAPGQPDNCSGLKNILLDWISLLLICWPLGLVAHYCSWGNPACFWLNFLAMIPLAKILGDATEELAAALDSDTIGGLLNATFGNAVEMILTIQTLRAARADPSLLNVVKGTLLGSVLSNLLLVLGMSFCLGGFSGDKIKGKVQRFNTEAALTNMTMLFVAVASFALPTAFMISPEVRAYTPEDEGDLTLQVSRWCSIFILISYIAFLVFQLYTHIDLFKSSGDDGGSEGDDEKGAELSLPVAMLLLLVSTILVAISSEFLVDSIDGLVTELRGTAFQMGKTFIGVVLLPIVGNACEHVGAVRMAMIDKVDITIGIAVGSSTQIALFVVPFSVLMGWLIDVPMDMNFGGLNVTVMASSVLIAFSVLCDGLSNWLEGFMLMIAYFVVAVLYWFFPES